MGFLFSSELVKWKAKHYISERAKTTSGLIPLIFMRKTGTRGFSYAASGGDMGLHAIMNSDVLVLNSGFIPVRVSNLREALCLVL